MSTDEGGFIAIRCGACGCLFGLSRFLYDARRADKGTFYCSNGHPRGYLESEADKLRRERDRLTQRLAEKDDEIKRQRDLREGTERQLSATRGVLTRIKNRVGHGVCPCCNRSFGDLTRHMKTKHPTYAAEAAE